MNVHFQSDNANGEGEVDASLKDIILELKKGETVVFDVEEDEQDPSDTIFDTLVMKGFHVKKTFLNGKHSIIVCK